MTSHLLHVVFGAGVLGRAVARHLAETGAAVRLVSRGGVTRLPGVECETGDLTDPASALRAGRDADILYFCAAPPYQNWPREFPALQEGAIALARRTGAVLVVAENLYGYGVAGHLTEDRPLAARTRKGAVRARMSHRLFEAHAGGEIRAVSGRASDFCGPEVRMSAFGERFWPELLKGRPINWFGDPDSPHTLTYLPDFARALVTLGATEAAWGRAWHVPSPETLSPRQIAGRAAALAGAPAPRFRQTPKLLLRLVGLAVPSAGELVEMEYSFAQTFVAVHDAWTAQFGTGATALDDVLRDTLRFWQAEVSRKAAA